MSVTVSLSVELALAACAEVGEGPVWDDSTGTLLWVDIPRGLVHRFDPATGSDTAHSIGQAVGAVATRKHGGLVLALREGFGLLDEDGGRFRLVCGVERDLTGSRMNDGKCDSAGRFWAGTMAIDLRAAAGTLYRLDIDHSVEPILSGLTISNGLAWSLDDQTMYFVDSATNGIDAFDYEAERGSIRNRRRIVQIPAADGMPDGLTIDTDGCLWVALWGGGAVRRFGPDGTLLAVAELPVAQVTSCAFGGERLDELYVTTASNGLSPEERRSQPQAGDLFRIQPGVRGLPAMRFGG